MIAPWVVIGAISTYMGFLFLIALWVERRASMGRNPSNNALVYSLSLAVYCTTWTYYGSVGKAVESGVLFLTIYLGPTLSAVLWERLLRKFIRLKNLHNTTSIADFISARYGKSTSLAALATIIALVGVIPYLALQLKAVTTTFQVITGPGVKTVQSQGIDVGLLMAGMMILFTIIFGIRRISPTERHQGVVMVVAIESVIKLVAFLTAGLVTVFLVFNGPEDIFRQFKASDLHRLVFPRPEGRPSLVVWATWMLLSMSAVFFLPRQFHVAVVENFRENHTRTASWLFPVYMLLINLFVVPIALAGLLLGMPASHADSFVLGIPLYSGHNWLSLFVFLGGFSAGTAMTMVSSMTLSTMVSNHLILPLTDHAPALEFLRQRLLYVRRLVAAAVILTAHWFNLQVGSSYMLANMGMISFAAALQFAPVMLGGLFWSRGSKKGAILGLGSGTVVWGWLLLAPTLSGAEQAGDLLRSATTWNNLGFDSLSIGVFWSMAANISGYVLGSLFWPGDEHEQRLTKEFFGEEGPGPFYSHSPKELQVLKLDVKIKVLEDLLAQYLTEERAESILANCLLERGLLGRETVTIVDLAEICHEIEKHLAGAIGAPAAHRSINQSIVFTEQERLWLSSVYADMLAELRLSPTELKQRVDYYQEREALLTRQAEELAETVREKEIEIEERLRVEAALRDHEQRLQDILDNSLAVIYLKDDQGRYLLVNRSFESVFKIKRYDVIGRTDTEILEPGPAAMRTASDSRAMDTGLPLEVDETIRLEDGDHTFISIKFPLRDQEGRLYGVCGMSNDITERIKSQEQLMAARQQLSDIIEFLPDATLVVTNKGKVAAWNRAMEIMSDTPKEEIIGRADYARFIPYYQPDRKVLVDLVARTDPESEAKYELFERKGHITAADVFIPHLRQGKGVFVRTIAAPLFDRYGRIAGAIESIRDITERKNAEAEVLRLSRFLERVIDNADVWISVMDDKGRPGIWNLAAERISGFSRDEALNDENIWRRLMPDDDERQAAIVGAMAEKDFEAPIICRDGALKTVSWTMRRLEDADGRPAQTILIGQDVTERRSLEKQLRQAQKMEAVGTLASGVAHDFNNILQAISGHVQLRLARLEQDHPHRGFLSEIDRESARAAALVKQLMTFSRRLEPDLKPMDLHEIINQAVSLLERTIPKMIRIKSELEPRPAPISGDPVQLEQVLMNLGANARDAMPEGGQLLFQTETTILDEAFCKTRGALKPGEHIMLRVSDTGEGIPKEAIEHIFEPFYTTKGVGRGTGLGLSMVYGIVTGHQGYVSCYSEPGQGTVFHFFFPRLSAVPLVGELTETPLAGIQGGNESILLVDDEPVILELGEEMLQEYGYRVRTANSGEAALEILDREGDEIDLVLMDLGMPGMGGFKCLTAIIDKDPARKVIISSGYLAQPLIADCKRAGAQGFVGKPYRIADLLARIREVLEE